jgi:hypothetical protein
MERDGCTDRRLLLNAFRLESIETRKERALSGGSGHMSRVEISALGGGFHPEADRQKSHDARRLIWHRILSRLGRLKGHQMALNETEMREWRFQGTETAAEAEADDVGHQSVPLSVTMAEAQRLHRLSRRPDSFGSPAEMTNACNPSACNKGVSCDLCRKSTNVPHLPAAAINPGRHDGRSIQLCSSNRLQLIRLKSGHNS